MEYDPEEVARVFGRAAATYDTVIPFFATFGAHLVDLAELRPGESVLDAGAGRGATLLPAADGVSPDGRVLGIDLSVEMVELLGAEIGRRGLTNASVERMNLQALDVDPGSFDVAVSSFVLHVLPDPAAGAAELWRALRPGGRVAASVPTPGDRRHWQFLTEIIRRFAPRVTRPVTLPIRPDFDLVSVLETTGFDLVRSVERHVDFAFADEKAWWDWSWSAGLRGLFEVLSPSDLEELRREAFSGVAAMGTSTGIPMRQTALLVLARKPDADGQVPW